MITNGYIELEQFGRFFVNLEYERHQNPQRGFSCYESSDESRYNREFVTVCVHNGVRKDIELYLKDKFYWLSHHSFAINLMEPGMMLPLHEDKYGFYRKKYNIDSIENICRVIIFLEDWKSGHISQIGKKLTPQWTAGEWVSWTGDTIHMAANLGHENRYVLQLTGLLNK